MVNGSRYYRALESVSFIHHSYHLHMPDPSPSTLTVLKVSNFLQLGRSGGQPQRTVYSRRLPVNTVIHTSLAGIEPTTFRLLVQRTTSSATDSPWYITVIIFSDICKYLHRSPPHQYVVETGSSWWPQDISCQRQPDRAEHPEPTHYRQHLPPGNAW